MEQITEQQQADLDEKEDQDKMWDEVVGLLIGPPNAILFKREIEELKSRYTLTNKPSTNT